MRNALCSRFIPILFALSLTATAPLRAEGPSSFQAGWTASSDPVYVGERFYLTLEVISREGSLTQKIQLDGLPPASHLTCEAFADLPVEIKAIDDRMCEIRRFRTRATLLQPGPCKVQATLRGTLIRKVQNYFFTQREERPISLALNPLTLTALSLPETHRPPNYSGAIGTGFALSAQIAPTSVVIGDLVTVSIRLQTDNPLSVLAAPLTPQLPTFKTYLLKVEPVTDHPLVQTYSQIIIPLSDQAHTWGPVTFSYFDPRLHDYVVLSQGPFELTFLAARPTPTSDYRVTPETATGSLANAWVPHLRKGRYPQCQAFTELYSQGKFQEALSLPLATNFPDSSSWADELFNRGCAWFALGMGEKAAVVFRSALYRDPRAADLREGFKQAMLSLASPLPPSGRIAHLWDHGTRREWAILLGIGLGLWGGGLGLRHKRSRGSRRLSTGLLILAALFLPLAGGGIHYRNDLARNPEAILISATTPVRLAPAESAQHYTDLPRGRWVRIHEINGAWIRISTDAVNGWVPASSTEPVASSPISQSGI